MKVSGKVQMGKKDVMTAAGRCLRIGKSVSTLRCGLAYAGNSIMKGDAVGIGMGLDTVAKTAMETEVLMPQGKAAVRSIASTAVELMKQLKAGKKISKKDATGMLRRIQDLGKKVNELYAKGAKDCV